RSVLARLQIGVNFVVRGVQLFCRLTLAPRRCRRRYVAVDGLLPVTSAGEGMRWHVQRMRRIGRNFRVTPRRYKSLLRQRWHVVRMDNVVCEPRMRGLLRKQFL